MKKLIYFMTILVLVIGSATFAANVVVVSETFETGTVSNNLTADGWAGQRGAGDEKWTTSTPFIVNGYGSTTDKISEAHSFPSLMYRPFRSSNTITDADTDIFIKADFYCGSQPMWFAPHIGGQSENAYPHTPIVGENQVKWDIWKADDFTDMLGGSWASARYEVALQMNINTTDITLSTGTLYYRPLGATYWTKDPILRDVVLGLTSDTKPSLWDSWWMYGMYNGGFDNLILGKGTDIPDAWTAANTPAPDGVKEFEDFETAPWGYDLTADGWYGQQPNYCNFQVMANWASGGKMAAADGIAPPNQAYKPFASPSGISIANTDVYIKADFLMDMPATVIWVGPHIGGDSGSVGPYFGIVSSKWNVQLPGGTELTGDSVTQTAYEAVLQMSINQTNVANSTGTLYYRPFGVSAWTKDTTLQNFNLHLTGGNNPQQWDSWYMAGLWYGGMDNLTLGVGTGASLSCVPPAGDLNGDCTVNKADLVILAGQWLQ